MSNIHSTAIIEPGTKIGDNVTIEPYVVIKSTVTLGDNVTIKSHVYLDGNTTIGDGTVIWPGASIGTKAQDLKFRGERTYVKIGKNCEIREFVTINSSCQEGSTVKVGDNCLIMAYCHIAHNCEIGNHIIMSNGSMLAGHVTIEDYAIIGGMTPIHQFVRVGEYAMVGGLSRITNDVPPYTLGGGVPYKLAGLNRIGLKRHNFDYEIRKDLTQAYKLTYKSGLYLTEAIERIKSDITPSRFIEHWINFCHNSKRGLIGLHGIAHQKEEDSDERELANT